jgi:hypothetical protein
VPTENYGAPCMSAGSWGPQPRSQPAAVRRFARCRPREEREPLSRRGIKGGGRLAAVWLAKLLAAQSDRQAQAPFPAHRCSGKAALCGLFAGNFETCVWNPQCLWKASRDHGTCGHCGRSRKGALHFRTTQISVVYEKSPTPRLRVGQGQHTPTSLFSRTPTKTTEDGGGGA